jgi:hypothetical protein
VKEKVLSRRSEYAEKRPQETEKIPRTTNDSSKRAVSPTVKQGELFETAILSESRQPEKTTRVADAMREGGLDERALARAYTKLLQKLLESAEGNVNDKLTLDVLKELGRTLEPAGSTSAVTDMEGSMALQLVHDIPRPSRSGNAGFGAKH